MSVEKILADHTQQDATNFGRLDERLDRLETDVKAIKAAQDATLAELTRYKGFVGGVVWVLGGLFAVAVAALTFLKR